ncbi:aminopeptidase [Calothrix sp. HK-06]|nr:aminopeptidase [Calothrix sp. HK-06]
MKDRQIKFMSRIALIRLGFLATILIISILWLWWTLFQMPEKTYEGELLSLSTSETILRDSLQKEIKIIGSDIGKRNYSYYENLQATASFLKSGFQNARYTVNEQKYNIGNQTYSNLEVEIRGSKRPNEIVIIGAHYDSAFTSNGANDNGSGAAAVLELGRRFVDKKPSRTLRFVEFVNEEPPFFWTDNMGSLVYAKRCKERKENIVAMLSLETMGYFSDTANSQKYPFPLNYIYPSTGNFIAFIGNVKSSGFVKNVIKMFRNSTKFPSQGAALPAQVPGAGWSDQWSFWQQGYSGVMVTDTAPFRYPYYHTQEDTPNKIDYARLSRVVYGLEQVIDKLVE